VRENGWPQILKKGNYNYKGEIIKAPPMAKSDVIQDNLEEYGITI
jgi:hypothetical protein